jgi:hypothetical protein
MVATLMCWVLCVWCDLAVAFFVFVSVRAISFRVSGGWFLIVFCCWEGVFLVFLYFCRFWHDFEAWGAIGAHGGPSLDLGHQKAASRYDAVIILGGVWEPFPMFLEFFGVPNCSMFSEAFF